MEKQLWSDLSNDTERLQGIVARLPFTKDGHPVVPGVTVMCPNGHAKLMNEFREWIYCIMEKCYSYPSDLQMSQGTYYEIHQCTFVSDDKEAISLAIEDRLEGGAKIDLVKREEIK